MEHYRDYTLNRNPSSFHQRQHNFSHSSGWPNRRDQYHQGYLNMEPYTINPSDYYTGGNQYSDYNDGFQEAYPSQYDPSYHQLARGRSHHSTHVPYHEDLTHAMPGSYPAHSSYDRVPYNPHLQNHQLHHPYPDRHLLGPVEPQQSFPNSLFQEHPASFRSPSPILDEMSILNHPAVTPSRTYSLGRQSYRSQYQQPNAYGHNNYHPSGMSYSRSSSPHDSNFYYSSHAGSYDDPYIDQAPYNGNYYTTPHYYGHPASYNTGMYPTAGVAGGYGPQVVPLNGGAGGYVVLPQAGQNVQVIDASGKTSQMFAPGYTYYGESFFSKLFSPSSWGFRHRKSSSSRRSSRSRRGSLWSFLDDL